MRVDELRSLTKKQLMEQAKSKKIQGRHDMTKADLINALASLQSKSKPKKSAAKASSKKPTTAAGSKAKPKTTASSSKRPAKPKAKPADLTAMTRQQLMDLAKERSIPKARSMKKDELLQALQARSETVQRIKKQRASRSPKASQSPQAVQGANRRTKGKEAGREKFQMGATDFAAEAARELPKDYGKDRIVTMVRDPYWLHVYWELTRKSVERTAAALGQEWYSAKPILRLFNISSDDTSSTSESVSRDIEIHGGVNNWYVDVQDPPGTYRVDIGYVTAKGRFYVLGRSNVVTTPRPGMSDEIDTHWPTVRDECERIYAMSGGADPGTNSNELRRLFEERLRRPMSSGMLTDFGSGALGEDNRQGFHFEIDAELIVFGRTEPHAKVTLQGEPLQIRPDGTFTVRFGMPDGRQILPATAQSRDGIEERTIILAIERNTKELEPMIHDGQD